MAPGGPDATPRRYRAARRLIRWLWGLIAVLVALLVVRTFILAPYRIPTGSMEPTLHGDDAKAGSGGDTVLVFKMAYLLGRPRRWDAVAFRATEPQGLGAGGERINLVKRVVGLPGETVAIADGEISIDGRIVPRPTGMGDWRYVPRGRFGWRPVTLGEGEYFVLGDNSTHSEDSRHWGPIKARDVFGRVVAVIAPWRRARWLTRGE